MMLSPRALQQGWKEELDSNIGQHKEWITKRKLEAVFDAGLPARELEEEVGAVVCSYLHAGPFTPKKGRASAILHISGCFLAFQQHHQQRRTNSNTTVLC